MKELAVRLLVAGGLIGAMGGLGWPAAAQSVAAPQAMESEPPKPGKRSWSIREFTSIQLVRREAGSVPNQHPSAIAPAVIGQQLASIQFVTGTVAQRLFSNDEIAELAAPLSQAIASAGPDDDLLVLSTSRRGEGFLSPPTGVTARLFVRDGLLQVLVNDTRLEFINKFRGTNMDPEFAFGSRSKPSSAVIQSSAGRSVRADWLALSLAAPASAGPSVAPAPAPPAPAAPAAAAASSDDIERRLTTLKRLRERNLISEEEYQSKRREILQQL